MLPFENDRQVVEIEYERNEWIPEVRNVRHYRISVLCTDNYNQQFAVDMQIEWTTIFKYWISLDASKAYILRFDREQNSKLPCPVYVIKLVDDIFEKSPEMKDKYYHHYKTVNARNTEERIDGLELIFVELPKFKPHIRTERKLRDLWLRYLTEIDESTKEVPSELLSDENIREAIRYSEKPYDERELYTYERSVISVVDERSLMSDSKEEGLVKGREEGRVKIALNALKKGMSPEDVSELTGLPLSEIHKLKLNNN
jgi:predicted transposase/invertase (TIGR01784 family)